MKRKGTTVRLTDRAHTLLSEKVGYYSARGHKISMKDIASEAIFMLVRSEDRDNELHAHIEKIDKASIKLQKRLPFYLFISAAVGTVAGVLIGVTL